MTGHPVQHWHASEATYAMALAESARQTKAALRAAEMWDRPVDPKARSGRPMGTAIQEQVEAVVSAIPAGTRFTAARIMAQVQTTNIKRVREAMARMIRDGRLGVAEEQTYTGRTITARVYLAV